ncbi:MAG: DUF3604 domain-containing protein [Gammaproteobacteria bacterium]|nr:DUF3604 domain-containing protein [Gammaproteobacteria bacterium]
MGRAILVLAAWLLFSTAHAAATLPSTLRTAVDRLQAESASVPTSAENRKVRAVVLWDWANAMASSGGELPVHATQLITYALTDSAGPALNGQLDTLIAELTLRDKSPDALGSITITPGPFTVNTFAEIKQTFTVGSRNIQTGGGFLIGRHFMANFGEWQYGKRRENNHLTVVSSNASVNFQVERVPFGGMHGGFRGDAERIVFRVASGTLVSGDTVTITYGDTRGGGKGLQLPTHASDAMPLPVYLAFDANTPFFSLPLQHIVLTGGELQGVAAFLPSTVTVNQPFSFSVRGEDARANRAAGVMPAWRVFANDKILAEVPAGGGAITVLDNTVLDMPGPTHIRVESADGKIKGQGNPVLVRAESGPALLWGDTHGHSGFAEGIGTAEAFMRWAKEDSRLDFVTHSEHDIFMDDAEWETLRRIVLQNREEGRFIPFLGYEWTVDNRRGGHHNVLFRTPEDRQRFDARRFPTLSRLYAGIRASVPEKDVLLIPHAHNSGDWRVVDPELVRLVEIMSQHGTFEWFGRMYLQHGHEVGVIAASDNHLSQPGYSSPPGAGQSQRAGLAAVYAPNKTTDGIFDALRGLRTYATNGDRIILDFNVNGAPMGTRAPMDTSRRISGQVIGTAPLQTVTVLKNDQVLWSQSYVDAPADKSAPVQIALEFTSSSEPLNPRDNPRGWRPWVGTVQVQGAKIVSGAPAAAANTTLWKTAAVAGTGNTWSFSTASRGNTSTLIYTLDEVKSGASILISIDAGREFGGAPPVFREHQPVEPVTLSVRMADLRDGAQTARINVKDYQDQITVRRWQPGTTREATFEVNDAGQVVGDWYQVRVTQTNDGVAWSSPVWIGGNAPH